MDNACCKMAVLVSNNMVDPLLFLLLLKNGTCGSSEVLEGKPSSGMPHMKT